MTFNKYHTSRCYLILALLLSSCKGGEILYSGLNEKEANLILMTLDQQGINGRKEILKEGVSVSVNSEEFSRSVNILNQEGLPTKSRNLNEFLTGDSNSNLVRLAKYTDYINSKLELAFEEIPWVTTASVISFIPIQQGVSISDQESTISILLTTRSSIIEDQVRYKIANIALRAIPGLLPDNIAIEFFKTLEPEDWSPTNP